MRVQSTHRTRVTLETSGQPDGKRPALYCIVAFVYYATHDGLNFRRRAPIFQWLDFSHNFLLEQTVQFWETLTALSNMYRLDWFEQNGVYMSYLVCLQDRPRYRLGTDLGEDFLRKLRKSRY